MASKPSDGWLWMSLAILGYCGSLAIHTQLVAIRQASEVTHHDKRPNINQQTEDALKLKALGELTQSPDPDIRAASVKIIIDRAFREGPAWDMIIHDLGGTDIERRDKALACFRFLCDSIEGNRQADIVICRHTTYKAIVDCLCNLLPEAQISEKNPALRTQPERNALYVLHHILGFDVPKALKAGVVSRWLAQYPFGGADAPEYKKKTILDILDVESFYDDSDFGCTMREMLFCLSRTSVLRQEMVEHGLLDVPKGTDITVSKKSLRHERWLSTDRVQDDWDMPEALPRCPYTMGTRNGVPVGTSNRSREESSEELALRRRRRQAMVLGEIGRPIERADIIERGSAALDEFRDVLRAQAMASLVDVSEEVSDQLVTAVADEDVEEELELLTEEITQAQSTKDGGWWGWLRRLRPDGLAPEPV